MQGKARGGGGGTEEGEGGGAPKAAADFGPGAAPGGDPAVDGVVVPDGAGRSDTVAAAHGDRVAD